MRFLSLQNTAFPASGSLFILCLKAEKTLPIEPVNTMGRNGQRYRKKCPTLTVAFFGTGSIKKVAMNLRNALSLQLLLFLLYSLFSFPTGSLIG